MTARKRSDGAGISIHALREEGDRARQSVLKDIKISIHALREEGDVFGHHVQELVFGISIHALREEGDYQKRRWFLDAYNFYPRPPRGGRLKAFYDSLEDKKISIHALREEGDSAGFAGRRERKAFLSTPSARRATAKTEKNISAFVSL